MSVIASWGPKKWEISPRKIVAIDGISTSVTLKAESNNDTSGTPPINTRGLELIPVSLEVKLQAVAGIDVRQEITSWEQLVGEVYPLYLGGQRFGPAQLQLQSVSTSDYVVDHRGRILSAALSIALLEYQEIAQKSVSSGIRSGGTSSSMGGGGTGSSSQTVSPQARSKVQSKVSAAQKKAALKPKPSLVSRVTSKMLSDGMRTLGEEMKRRI